MWARSLSLVLVSENCWFSIRTTPRLCGEDFKNAKSQRTRSEQVSFRNCRLYRISPDSWREFFLAQSKAVYAENFRERHKKANQPGPSWSVLPQHHNPTLCKAVLR